MAKIILNTELMIPFFPMAENMGNIPRKKKKLLKKQMSKFIVDMLSKEVLDIKNN